MSQRIEPTLSEADAIAAIDRALSALDDVAARRRVLSWANDKFGNRAMSAPAVPSPIDVPHEVDGPATADDWAPSLSSPAHLWLRRNSIPVDDRLARIFSIDQPQVDLIAAEIPGQSTKARMRALFLLRGACAYLTSGEFRFSDDVVRETCRQYGAYDSSNFSMYLRSFNDEVAGSRDSGYSLTARGQRAAADLIKQMLNVG